MSNQPIAPVHYFQYHHDRWEIVDAHIIGETPVSLSINGEVWLTFMCTPTDLEALAVGFLYNEGLIQRIEEIADVSVCASGELVDVWLTHRLPRPLIWKRTTGCSGGMTAVEEKFPLADIEDGGKISPRKVFALIEKLLEAQELYRLTGGVHTSILSDGENTIASAEDIGRHNTLDKIAGKFLINRLQAESRFLVTTGRISSEMLQKAGRIKAAILISRTSPNALSVRMAQRMGITLIGYGRRDQFLVYTHPYRIEGAPIEVSEACST